MIETRSDFLARYAAIFEEEQGGEDGPRRECLQSLGEFYRLLSYIDSGRLLNASTDYDRHSHLLPERLRILSELTRGVFVPRPREDMYVSLEGLLKQLIGEDNLLPEAQIVKDRALQWLKTLDFPVQKGEITLALSPSLALNTLEEGEADEGGKRCTTLPVAVTYSGVVPAFNAQLACELGEDVITLPDCRSSVQHIPVGDLYEGQTIIKSLQLLHGKQGRIGMRASFTNFLPDRTWFDQFEREFTLGLSLSVEPLRGSSSPYRYEIPLVSDSDWQLLARGRHKRIIERLSEKLGESGGFFAVTGLRRSGKTTVLRRLEVQADHNAGVLPVYIDLFNWWLPLQSRNEEISGGGLLYELADSAIRRAQAPGAASLLLSMIGGKREQKHLSLKIHQFSSVLACLRSEKQLKPAFLLDEVDSWLDESRFELDAVTFFRELRGLVEEGACSVVAAHTRRQGWNLREKNQRLFPETSPIELLDRTDVEALAQLADVPTTEMAVELIWKVTGGWPGLLQLLLHNIYENCNLQNGIDAGAVKHATSALLSRRESDPVVGYFFESIGKEERNALRIICSTLNHETSELTGVHFRSDRGIYSVDEHLSRRVTFDMLDTVALLASKGIIEPLPMGTTRIERRCRLRIGLFYYDSAPLDVAP